MAVSAESFWPLPATWRVLIFDKRGELDEHLAAEFITRLRTLAHPQIALASGATFGGLYAGLRSRVDAGLLDLRGVTFTHLDEFRGLAPREPGSLSAEIVKALFPDDEPRRGSFWPIAQRHPDAGGQPDAA